MTGLVRTAAALIVVLGAASCFAADEETPKTGTIEVEVVYTDTGEPVETPTIEVRGPEGPRGVELHPPDEDGVCSVTGPFGRYGVTVRTSGWFFDPNRAPAPSTPQAISQVSDTVVISDAHPIQRIRFELASVHRLEGIVQRADGSPVVDALVYGRCRLALEIAEVERSDTWLFPAEPIDPRDPVCDWTDDKGRFVLHGLLPGRTDLEVRVTHSFYSQVSYPLDGSFSLWRGGADISDGVTPLSVQVQTGSLDVRFETVHALWPFRRYSDSRATAIAMPTVDESPVALTSPPIGRLDIRFTSATWDPRSSTGLEIHHVRIDDLPRGRDVEVALEITDDLGTQVVRATRTVKITDTDQDMTVRAFEPHAVLSRHLRVGLPPLVALAVFGTILFRQIRKRRAKEAAT